MKQKNLQLAKDFSIEAKVYANQANAILGIKKAGKSYTASKAAELLMDAGIPIIVFDPIGIWKYLKVSDQNDGYPVVVAGGEGSDIILTPDNCKDIVRAAMKENVSLVIDLYCQELANKSTWIRIVESCVHLLLYENKPHGIRHVILEEAAEFIPQRPQPQHAKVYAEIEKLVRMGRNVGLGITIINQRAEEINKAILEICDLSFLHRQVGKNSLISIQKWFEFLDVENVRQVVKELPLLERGKCFVVGEDRKPKKISILPKKSFHPDPNDVAVNEMSYQLKRDVGDFVLKINQQLLKTTITKQVKQPDVKNNIKEIADLVLQVGAEQKRANQLEAIRKRHEQIFADISDMAKNIVEVVKEFDAKRRLLNPGPAIVGENGKEEIITPTEKRIPIPTPKQFVPSIVPSKDVIEDNGSLPQGERTILIAILQQGKPLRREQITAFTGYKQTSRDTYIPRLKRKGFLHQMGDKVAVTEEGENAVGKWEPLPTGSALREFWFKDLPEGESKILQVVCNHYPSSCSREMISEETGYKQTSRDTYIPRLLRKDLLVKDEHGFLKAPKELFD